MNLRRIINTILLMIPLGLFAQETLSGKVQEASNGGPLEVFRRGFYPKSKRKRIRRK